MRDFQACAGRLGTNRHRRPGAKEGLWDIRQCLKAGNRTGDMEVRAEVEKRQMHKTGRGGGEDLPQAGGLF